MDGTAASPEVLAMEHQAELMLGPKERYLTQKIAPLAELAPHLKAAGVTPEQIAEARDKAGRAAETEYAAMEAASPVSSIRHTIESLPVAPDQQEVKNLALQQLQDYVETIHQEDLISRAAANRSGRPYDSTSHFRALEQSHENNWSFVELTRNNRFDRRFNSTQPTVEAILGALGTLQPGETVDTLRQTVPDFDNNHPDNQGQLGGSFYNLPTTSEGVKVVYNPMTEGITLRFKPEAIVRSLPPTTPA